MSLVPAFHILGYIYGFSTPAAARGTTVFSRGSSPQGWVEMVRTERPRLVVGVPLHYRLMVQLLDAPLPEAVYLCSGGPLDPAIAAEFERRAGWPVLQVYGSTETGGIAVRRGSGPMEPFPQLAWKSRESDGRLVIKSAWQDRPSDWHCTDDVVAVEEGTFRLLGRADSVVKIGGRRFSTGEVVQTALAAPGVAQAHALPYDRFGEHAIALFVVASDGRSGLGRRRAGPSRLAPGAVQGPAHDPRPGRTADARHREGGRGGAAGDRHQRGVTGRSVRAGRRAR